MSASNAMSQIVRRLPLIKFRYVKSLNGFSGLAQSPAVTVLHKPIQSVEVPQISVTPQVTPKVVPAYKGVSVSNSSTSTSLEFHQLPKKYRRPAISQLEMDIINNGGAY